MKILPLALLLSLTYGVADAQELRRPTTIFATAAVSDWVSTYRFLASDYALVEKDPLLRFTHNSPLGTVAAGAAMDVAGVWAWNRFVGRRHPKLARAGLYTMTAMRIGLTVSNTRLLHHAQRADR